MMIKINEIFPSIQGEGYWTGTPVTFVRFSGCNRVCSFCDTNHQQYTEMSVDNVVEVVRSLKQGRVVITGGEPTVQMDGLEGLCIALRREFKVHVETNGDIQLDPDWPHWLTVSPKDLSWKQHWGHELKLVYTGQSMEELEEYRRAGDFRYYFLQPNDNKNIKETVQMVMASEEKWQLSLQTHKLIGVR